MSRSPPSQRTESERRVLEYLSGHHQARTKDLRRHVTLSPATLHSVLRALESRDILKVQRERHQTIYLWTNKAENYYKGIIPKQILVTRRYYEELAKTVSMDASAEEFVERTSSAIGVTMLPVLLESVEKEEEILLQPVINDFLFFIRKFLIYKKHPEALVGRIAKASEELENDPGAFRKELGELLAAVAKYRRNLEKGLERH